MVFTVISWPPRHSFPSFPLTLSDVSNGVPLPYPGLANRTQLANSGWLPPPPAHLPLGEKRAILPQPSCSSLFLSARVSGRNGDTATRQLEIETEKQRAKDNAHHPVVIQEPRLGSRFRHLERSRCGGK